MVVTTATVPERDKLARWFCQPWFYRRLVAYSFVGLCEGA